MKKPKPISDEDFASWKDNVITQAVFAHFGEVRKIAHDRWAGLLSGEVPSDPRPMQLLQVELKAKLEFIEDMLSLELSDIQEEDNAATEPSTEQRVERVRRARAG